MLKPDMTTLVLLAHSELRFTQPPRDGVWSSFLSWVQAGRAGQLLLSGSGRVWFGIWGGIVPCTLARVLLDPWKCPSLDGTVEGVPAHAGTVDGFLRFFSSPNYSGILSILQREPPGGFWAEIEVIKNTKATNR